MEQPQLCIAPALVQHYLLEVKSNSYASVGDELYSLGNLMIREHESRISQWRLFTWLDRPTIWALRAVEVTSGLDTFLLQGGAMDDVTDVAEIITYPIVSATASGNMKNSWAEFEKALDLDGTLFACFLWPDWETLTNGDSWGQSAAPARSQVIAACRVALDDGLSRAKQSGLIDQNAAFVLCGSVGDCDLVLYGYVNKGNDIDAAVYIATQLGCDSLAAVGESTAVGKPWPVFRATHTELAIPLERYVDAIRAAEAGKKMDNQASKRIDRCLAGEMLVEIGLSQSRKPVSAVQESLEGVIEDGWSHRAVFGREDFILSPSRPHSLSRALQLLAELDIRAAREYAFPRRSSIRVGTNSGPWKSDWPHRSEIFGSDCSRKIVAAPVPPTEILGADPTVLSLIHQLRAMGWREDLRILERMVERCVTLQKSPYLRYETRIVLKEALSRIMGMCRYLKNAEEAEVDEISESGERLTADEVAKAKRQKDRTIRLRRRELLQAGISIDRVVSHHSKGAVVLLLQRATQARGPEHIGSEIGLSLGLGILFQSPIERLLSRLDRANDEISGDEAKYWMNELRHRLAEVARPIIYASHEPDFYIRPELNLLRIPRWAMWYPGAASHLIHELGHALAIEGSLAYIMSKFLFVVKVWADSCCPILLKALTKLGFPKTRREYDKLGLPLSVFADKAIKGKEEQNFGVDPELLKEGEEITADVISRLFAYGDREDEDAQQLWDCFDYLIPFSSRHDAEQNNFRMMRLLAAHIVVWHVREVRMNRSLKPLSVDGQKRLWDVTIEATAEFQRHSTEWLKAFRGRPEYQYLPQAISDAVSKLPVNLSKLRQSLVLDYQRFAHVISSVFLLPPLPNSKHQSLFKASQLWGRVVDVAWEEPENDAEQQAVTSALIKGEVPSKRCRFPERLPRALMALTKGRERPELPANARWH